MEHIFVIFHYKDGATIFETVAQRCFAIAVPPTMGVFLNNSLSMFIFYLPNFHFLSYKTSFINAS